MTDESTQSRFINFESQLAETQKTLDELSDVVRRQGEEIDLLKAEIEVLGREILLETEGKAKPTLGSGL